MIVNKNLSDFKSLISQFDTGWKIYKIGKCKKVEDDLNSRHLKRQNMRVLRMRFGFAKNRFPMYTAEYKRSVRSSI